jgi:hypothetical protein
VHHADTLGARGRFAYELITLSDCNSAHSAVNFCFIFVGITGFWKMPAACVNCGAFRQDERDKRDALRVGSTAYEQRARQIISQV